MLEILQKAEQKDQDEKQMALDRSIWGTDLPYYDYIIRTFLEFLAEVAKQEGDSVYTYSPSSSYYQCLPQEINIKTGDTNVAELRLSKNTNWDFQIIIESKDSQNRRPLKIKSKGGGAVFRPNFWVTPNILTIDLFNGDGSVIFTQNRPLPQQYTCSTSYINTTKKKKKRHCSSNVPALWGLAFRSS